MCHTAPNPLESMVRQAVTGMLQVPLGEALPPAPTSPHGLDAVVIDQGAVKNGSRRRRVWELDASAHCPVIGVCLPMAALRRLVNKAIGGQAVAGDYELHCGTVNDTKQRTPVAESIQKELDRRYLPALRQVALCKTTEALAAWWDDALRNQDVAGPLWAVLTHARCTPVLEHRVLSEVHMLQHQAGTAARVDLHRFEALIDENAVIARELGTAQQRNTRQAAEAARRSETQALQIAQLRTQLHARDADIQRLRERLQSLESAVPSLHARVELSQHNQAQAERIHELERSALQARQEAESQARRADALAAELAEWQQHQRELQGIEETQPEEPSAAAAAARFDTQAVLCVGGRTAAVPLYRHIVETVGGKFLHHDGGLEDSSSRLEATLAAADLVICQTGCISHNAYWRVKEHCKRTGKQCVFIETPSTAGLKRALAQLQPDELVQVINTH